MTEQKAIEGCRKQDRICQKYLYDAYADGMMMVCVRYVKNLPDAEELLLNGFFNFFMTIDRFVYHGSGSIGGWLKKIMVNECLMHLRKKGLKFMPEDYARDLGNEDDQLGRLNAHEILKMVMTLPEGYRTVFNLYVVEGYTHREISRMLDISEGTSKSQLNKARKQLQKAITEQIT